MNTHSQLSHDNTWYIEYVQQEQCPPKTHKLSDNSSMHVRPPDAGSDFEITGAMGPGKVEHCTHDMYAHVYYVS